MGHEYLDDPSNTSGARYHRVTTFVSSQEFIVYVHALGTFFPLPRECRHERELQIRAQDRNQQS
jgi:hypothetical protein